MDSVYKFDPYAGLTPAEQKYILGVQANLWTEYIRDLDYLEYMTLPRLAAIAEIGWTYGGKMCIRDRARIAPLVFETNASTDSAIRA